MSILLNSQAVDRNFRLRPALPTEVIPESMEESELRKIAMLR